MRHLLLMLMLLLALPASAAELATAAQLASLLPPVPARWAAEESSAAVIEAPTGRMVEASRSYWHGHGPKTTTATDDIPGHAFVDVLLGDRGATGDAVLPWRIPDPPAGTSPNAFVRNVEISGQPGYELSEPSHGATEIGLLVRDRYVVRLRGAGISLDDLRGWLNHVKLDALR